MTKIKYNHLEISNIHLGQPRRENKGIFIPIFGPKGFSGSRSDPLLFQTPLLDDTGTRAVNPEKNNQMFLSINNIESLVLSSIIDSKEEIFSKKIPSDALLKKNFKSMLDPDLQIIHWDLFQVKPPNTCIILFQIVGVLLSGSCIKLELKKITVHAFQNNEPLETLGESSDESSPDDSDENEAQEELFEFDY